MTSQIKEIILDEYLDVGDAIKLMDIIISDEFKKKSYHRFGSKNTIQSLLSDNIYYMIALARATRSKEELYSLPHKNINIRLRCYDCNTSHKVNLDLDFVNAKITLNDIKNEKSNCKFISRKNKLKFKLKAPSGKIVIANDMRDLSIVNGDNDPGDFSINHKLEMINMMRAYEEKNFLYMQCGNSSPTIYKNDKGEIIIGHGQ